MTFLPSVGHRATTRQPQQCCYGFPSFVGGLLCYSETESSPNFGLWGRKQTQHKRCVFQTLVYRLLFDGADLQHGLTRYTTTPIFQTSDRINVNYSHGAFRCVRDVRFPVQHGDYVRV